jgi:nicotinamide-nucleotide amidase
MVRVSTIARAAIVAVGSELLTPSRVDTNSLIITAELNRIGIDVAVKVIVGDDRRELAHVFREAIERTALVVVSGGLGPTDDDVTREVAAEVFGRPLVEDPRRIEALRARFAARGFEGEMPANNRRQAMVPSGARVIENPHGSAPGLWLEGQGAVMVLLPGPPRELKPMLRSLTDGWLRERSSGVSIARRVTCVVGRIESEIDETLQPLYLEWRRAPVPVSVTILATPGQIELHLSARGSQEEAEAAVAAAARQVEARLGLDVFSTDGRSLEEVAGAALLARGWQIAVAESCTGGLIASRLTDVPGSSRYVKEAVVAYANAAKSELLGVPAGLIADCGAVSAPVAIAMAEGIRVRAGADVGLGVTGIAGPDGGSADKPVGTVFVAAATGGGTTSRRFHFVGERGRVKFQASQAALDMVRRLLDRPDAASLAR